MLSDSAPRRRLLGTRHVSFLVARRGVSPLLSPSVILSCQFQIQIWLYAIHNYQTHITRSDGWRDLKETDFCTIVLLYKMWQTSTGWLAALDRKRIIIPSSYRNKFQIIIHFVVWVGMFGCVLQERFITCCTANHPSFIFTGCNCHSRMWRVLHGWCGSVHNLGTFVIQELFK